jgi:signal transduction histidine kinase
MSASQRIPRAPDRPGRELTVRAPSLLARARALVAELVHRLSVGDGTFDRPPPFDVLLAASLGGAAVASYLVEPLTPFTMSWAPVWLGWLLLVPIHLPLVWRRVAPVVTMACTGTATGLYFILGFQQGATSLAVLVALYSVSAYGVRSDGVISLVLSVVFVGAGLMSAASQGMQIGALQFAVNLFVFVGIWGLGDRTRTRREVVAQLTARAEEAERSRELAAGLAVADERTRIARELHDVVAHTVSVVVVQAGAGRRIAAKDPARAAEALADIEATGRDALEELRRLVGVLRDDGAAGTELAPQPRLAELDDLVRRLAETGIPVELHRRGSTRQLPPGIEVSAYRIVQEALTNVLKHAGPVSQVDVRLAYAPDTVTVEITDDGMGTAGTIEDRGSGLVGMRERVGLYRGTLHAGPRPAGGFEVVAHLPVRAAAVEEVVP